MSIHLKIPGMNCMSCVGKVQRVVREVPGVTAIRVDQETTSAEVDGLVQVEELLKALKQAGYPSKVQTPSADPSQVASAPNWLGGTTLALVIMGLLMVGEWGLGWGHQTWFRWVSFGLTLGVLLGVGRHFFVGAWNMAKQGQSNMDTLVALGSGSAFSLSVYGLLRPGHLHHLYFLEATAIVALIGLGHTLEALTTRRAGEAMSGLLKQTPEDATRIESSGQERLVKIEELHVGDVVVVRPGGRVPTDGIITSGVGILDESLVTGESTPIRKGTGERVLGGSINLESLLRMEVQAIGSDTALARIVKLVKEAQQSRADIQRLADRLSSLLVTGVILAAIATVLGWGFLGHEGWEVGIIHAVSVLVVACPCAMGLATPTALMVAVAVASRRGVLIRGAQSLEKCGRITAVLFDKTGTLTEAQGAIQETLAPQADPEQVASLVKALVQSTTHPVGRMLAAKYSAAADIPVVNWQEIRGSGASAQWHGQNVRLGSLSWLRQSGVAIPAEQSAGTALALGNHWLASFDLQPRIKPKVSSVIAELQSQGLKVFLVTGDRQLAANDLAGKIGIPLSQVYAEVTPEKKADIIGQLQASGEKVAFIGDGLNDGPALARSDLGMAVLGAADLARESADVIFLRPDIEAVPDILGLSSATLRTIQQNFVWALIYNALSVPLAMAGYVPPILCAAAMGLSDLCVIGNSLRLFFWKPRSLPLA